MKPEETAALLANPDVQRMMGLAAGLINGTHKLVIESEPKFYRFKDPDRNDPTAIEDRLIGFKHTFRVEESNGGK